jgi:hypothetical protein
MNAVASNCKYFRRSHQALFHPDDAGGDAFVGARQHRERAEVLDQYCPNLASSPSSSMTVEGPSIALENRTLFYGELLILGKLAVHWKFLQPFATP